MDDNYEIVEIRGGKVFNKDNQEMKKGMLVQSTSPDDYSFVPASRTSLVLYSKNCGKICLISPSSDGSGFVKYFAWLAPIIGWDTEERTTGSRGGCDSELLRLQNIFNLPDENGVRSVNYYAIHGQKQQILVDTSCFPLSENKFFAFEYFLDEKHHKYRIPNDDNLLTILLSSCPGLEFSKITAEQQSLLYIQWNYYDFDAGTMIKISEFKPYLEMIRPKQ